MYHRKIHKFAQLVVLLLYIVVLLVENGKLTTMSKHSEVEHEKNHYYATFCVQFKMPKGATILLIAAIAEVYKNEGNNEYNKNNFDSAIHFYTEGIKANCKDEDLNAKLYSNRAAAHFNLGKEAVALHFLFNYLLKATWRQQLLSWKYVIEVMLGIIVS